MFERQLALERAQGHRGPATRLFGPMPTLWEAQQGIRDACLALLAICGLLIILAFWGRGVLLIPALLVGASSLVLMSSRHRLAAIILFFAVFAAGQLVLWMSPGIVTLVLAVAMFVLAIRASRATFLVASFRGARAAMDATPSGSA